MRHELGEKGRFFKRTPDMIFALERRTIGLVKGKTFVLASSTVPIIRYQSDK